MCRIYALIFTSVVELFTQHWSLQATICNMFDFGRRQVWLQPTWTNRWSLEATPLCTTVSLSVGGGQWLSFTQKNKGDGFGYIKLWLSLCEKTLLTDFGACMFDATSCHVGQAHMARNWGWPLANSQLGTGAPRSKLQRPEFCQKLCDLKVNTSQSSLWRRR